MNFDVKCHDQCPKGFTVDPVMRIDEKSIKQSAYDKKTNEYPKICGMDYYMGAVLKTHYKKSLFRRIDYQDAALSLYFDTAFDGYEKAGDQRGVRTYGYSIDHDKKRAARELERAIAKELDRMGYACDTEAGVKILLKDDGTSPIEQIETLYALIAGWAKQYEEGQNPFPEVTPPKGTVRTNPRNIHLTPLENTSSGSTGVTTASTEPKTATWVVQTKPEVVKVATLAQDYFKIGHAVEKVQYELFEGELKKLFPNNRTRDNLKREKTMAAAKEHFPLGSTPTEASHNNFKAALEKAFARWRD